MSLAKTASVTSYSAPGTPITYSYKVTNTGNVNLNSVSVTDPQPGLSAVSCPNASLAPGAFETCTATYTTTQADVDAGSISNTGTASGTPPTGPAITATSSLTISASDTPALTLKKSASTTSYSVPGTLITYSYLVTNTGNVNLTAVSVTDPQPGLSAVNCPIGTLAPAAFETCTATYSTTQADLDAGSISNTGTASGTPPTGPAITTTSAITILASDTPAVSVVKSANVANYSAPGTSDHLLLPGHQHGQRGPDLCLGHGSSVGFRRNQLPHDVLGAGSIGDVHRLLHHLAVRRGCGIPF